MERLEDIQALFRAGRFRQALASLEGASLPRDGRMEGDVLRAELLERTGRHGESKLLVDKLLKRSGLPAIHRSTCEFTLGLIAWDAGEPEPAINHFQKAVSYAQLSKDMWRTCWAQLRLIVALVGRDGPSTVSPLLASARLNAVKVGDPIVSAAFHVFIGETEAKRGLLESAQRHTELGQRLLRASPNLWLEAVVENSLVAIALMRSDFDQAVSRGERALKLAEESGAAAMHRACLGNLGNIFYSMGEFERAIEFFQKANETLPSKGECLNSGLDSLARIHLLRERLDLAEECLDVIERSIKDRI